MMKDIDPREDRTAEGLPTPEGPDDAGAHVEGHLSVNTEGDEPEGSVSSQTRRSVRRVADQVREQADEWGEDAGDHLRELRRTARSRVSRWSETANSWGARKREEVQAAVRRAETEIDERTGLVAFLRRNPLVVIGIAAGLGYALAGSRGGDTSGVVGRVRGALRTTLAGGISTLLMHEVQELLDEHGGPLGLFESLRADLGLADEEGS
jgi:ElaB/YqjD/DUF883 family membrane-anchored ribosome-binding protein